MVSTFGTTYNRETLPYDIHPVIEVKVTCYCSFEGINVSEKWCMKIRIALGAKRHHQIHKGVDFTCARLKVWSASSRLHTTLSVVLQMRVGESETTLNDTMDGYSVMTPHKNTPHAT